MSVTGLLKGTADESDVVGSTASTTGLTDDHGNLVCVIFTGKDSFHDLADYHQ